MKKLTVCLLTAALMASALSGCMKKESPLPATSGAQQAAGTTAAADTPAPAASDVQCGE